ncbi:beta-glucosidase family protein [Amnibacterium kyonggiense]|uniref:Beta-glucosidase n=1 Tax=Amnibacterium kyonggiense TaxID=595671 RepID=A0A4R7FLX0_9MICO|nr:glycoside hydrolase family 3 C-terminal domain-containing protein [Amnibacterium kyonggiense]TDS77425.1 beta-glucosidase [Amnibacterium kyonggiense]
MAGSSIVRGDPRAWADAVRAVQQGADADETADALLALLRDRELLGLLDGDAPGWLLPFIPVLQPRRPFTAGAIPRLGMPGLRFTDGARGVVLGRATAFPVAIARAAAWDPGLEERVGVAIGLEARASGANYAASVCVNLLRHPAWGRAQECYGEDPVLTGVLGSAAVRGLRRNVMACVKHFALNSMEDARFEVDVVVDEHALHEVYLPQFRATIDAGADSLMTSYNRIRGLHADVNAPLLTGVLREEWGFRGFTTSDWVFGTHAAVGSLAAGLDVEMPLRLVRARRLASAARSGRLKRSLAEEAGRRILRTSLLHAAQRDPAEPAGAVVASPAHRALAKEAAVAAAVLLRNEPVDGRPLLPLDGGLGSVAVIGAAAARPNLGDHGSSRVRPPTADTPLDALRAALPAAEVRWEAGRDRAAAAALARDADAAVVVVGYDQDDEGESVVTGRVDPGVLGSVFRRGPLRTVVTGVAHLAERFVRGGDRVRLTLRPHDEALVRAVAAANPRTVVVLIGGSAILTESWRQRVPAVLLAWYGGMAGGAAIADVLTGAAEPGGRLPFAVPTDAAHLPPFQRLARRVVYDDRWGQRRLDADGHRAAYPFGWGLGYTDFALTCEGHRFDDGGGEARVRVENTGSRPGSTVVQVFAADASRERPVGQLLGFAKVRLAPGASATVPVALDARPTLERDPDTRTWGPRPGDWRVLAAQHAPSDWGGAVPLR